MIRRPTVLEVPISRPIVETYLVRRPVVQLFTELDLWPYGTNIADGVTSGYQYVNENDEVVLVNCPQGMGFFLDNPEAGCQNMPNYPCPTGFLWTGTFCQFQRMGEKCSERGAYDEHGSCVDVCKPNEIYDPQKGCLPVGGSTSGGSTSGGSTSGGSTKSSGGSNTSSGGQGTPKSTTCGPDEIKDASGRCVSKKSPPEGKSSKKKDKSSSWPWIVGGVVLAAVAGGVWYLSKRKDEGKNNRKDSSRGRPFTALPSPDRLAYPSLDRRSTPMEHDDTKSSPTTSDATVLSAQDQEEHPTCLIAAAVGLHSKEATGVAEAEAVALHEEESLRCPSVDPVSPTDEVDVLSVEPLDELFLGPDDVGSVHAKYGGPAMMHPGGDLTVRVAQECPLLVAFNGTKHEVFSPGNILPTDLWSLKSGSVVAARPMAMHLRDGGVVVVPEGAQLPTTCILVEKGDFHLP